MFFLSLNLRFKFQSKFLTCFDGCDVIKIPLFNSNNGAAKNETVFGSFHLDHDAVNCASGMSLLVSCNDVTNTECCLVLTWALTLKICMGGMEVLFDAVINLGTW